ncbi:putative pentatricopeptide repeat-containing protein [Ananas comosus]|uniref:Putative pentatricopeptide repeat-containing protein n=1 Tax=Ananas comosus TaxID=4615 RepID=A0A199UHE6_ANACO|nr:putative pentatricopeptide repeat-containing protein [Ananas comosus]
MTLLRLPKPSSPTAAAAAAEPSVAALLGLCRSVRALEQVHALIIRRGLEQHHALLTRFVSLCGSCAAPSYAAAAFRAVAAPSLPLFNALLAAHARSSPLPAALAHFNLLRRRSPTPRRLLLPLPPPLLRPRRRAPRRRRRPRRRPPLRPRRRPLRPHRPRRLLRQVPRRRRRAPPLRLHGDAYAKAGDMVSARSLFDKLKDRDLFSWSAVISGYAQNGRPGEALKIFSDFYEQNIRPDEFIVVGLMSACAQLGSLTLAKWVDSYITRCSIDTNNSRVFIGRIDMNAKCGNMERASLLFDSMPDKNVVSYCSMMQGYLLHGSGAKAVELFSQMLEEGLSPDNVSFTVVLTACSHAGLVEEGKKYFALMRNEFSIVPSSDHYACMVDLLGRSGKLKEAYELIESMPVEPHAGAWGALLGACRVHCDIELGDIVAKKLFKIEPQNAGNYVSLSNIYAASDRWEDVSDVRTMMRGRGVRKIPGCTFILP